MEDGREVPCAILTVFSVETNEYIALLPLEEDGKNHNGEVYLYKFSRTENGDPIMDNIEDDDEYTAAAENLMRFSQMPEKQRWPTHRWRTNIKPAQTSVFTTSKVCAGFSLNTDGRQQLSLFSVPLGISP